MRRRVIVVLAVLATAFAMLPAGASDQTVVIDRPTPQILERIGLDPADKPAPNLDDTVQVFVHLEGASVAELMASANAQGKGLSKDQKESEARSIEARQASFARQLERMGAKINWSMQWAENGVAITATVADLLDIQNLAGVEAVGGIATHEPVNDGSVPWIVSPEVQEAVSGGAGISIGIIDTGIDYLHANFGGPGTIEAYESNDPTTLADGGFTAKVVGGYDFVGDAYDASSDDEAVATPVPDEDPLDCNGHGSHVAGTAAGLGVPGLIGPGVAPQADLYALKVFGCDGSTSVTALAIEWAVAHDLDVINMSLGSDFGSPLDPSVTASNNAADAGVIVVASAGNDGDVPYVTGSPGVAEKAISVAASYDGGYGDGAIEVVESPDGSIVGLHPMQEGSIGPPLSVVGPIQGEIAVAIDNESPDPTFGCFELDNPEDITGKIALIQRGECSFGDKVANAEAAGAIATIVYNDAARGDALVSMGFATSDSPSVFIGHTAGSAIAAAAGGGAVVVELDAGIEIPDPSLADHIVDFSSSGPGGTNTYKPEISAPGVRIRSTAVGTGDKFANYSGTSMAAPHIAGVAALLRAQHPDAPVDVIKSLMMNSTVPAADGSPIVRQGNGVVRTDAAAALDAYTSPAGLSFGRLNPIGPDAYTQSVTVHDMSGSARTFDISAVLEDAPVGVSVSAPPSVEVPADGSASFDVILSLDPSAMDYDDGFYSQTNASGIVTLTHDTTSLRVGFTAAVDPASNVAVFADQKKGQEDGLLIANDSNTVGWADSFTYSGSGVGSVAAIGFRSDVSVEGVVDFGIAQSAPWDSLSTRETDVYLDTDEDGTFDYVLIAVDVGYLTTGFPEGAVVTALLNLSTGSFLLEWYVVGDYNDHVQTLLVDRHGTYGFLEPGDNDFDYLVVAYDLRNESPDGLAAGSVDLTKAGTHYSLGLGPTDAGIIRPMPQNRDAMLWTFQNNAVPSQFAILELAPNNKGGNSGSAPGKGGGTPPGQGGTPPGNGGNPPGQGGDNVAPGLSGSSGQRGAVNGQAVGRPELVGRDRAALRGPVIE